MYGGARGRAAGTFFRLGKRSCGKTVGKHLPDPRNGPKGHWPTRLASGSSCCGLFTVIYAFLLHSCGRRVKRLLVELGAGQGVECHVFDIRNPFSGLFLSLRCPLSAFHAFWIAFPAKPLYFHRPVQFSEQNSDARKKYHSHF